MKDVYVIKVKTRPPLSSLYPSERRYSASTVGGLSLVHLGLSILAFLLGTLARSLQGPVLSLSCLFPFVSGLLAWRRWYIDRNISIFFYGSLFSLVFSILCGVATVFDIASMSEGWKLENLFSYPEEKRIVRIMPEHMCNETSTCETETLRYFSFWRSETRANILLDVNVLVTCVLEMLWSVLSLRISFKGMRNRVADNYDSSAPIPERTKSCGQSIQIGEDQYDECLRDIGFRRTSVTDNSGPRLPLPESKKEFRERVERFLANQAAHRIVEGSCS